MKTKWFVSSGIASAAAAVALGASAVAASNLQIGASGKTFASSVVACAIDPGTGALSPAINAGLYQPKSNTKASVSLNGSPVVTVTSANPVATVWLVAGSNTVVVATSKRVSDSYSFTVQSAACSTAGNTVSPDGLLEYGASGKSYATVTPGCALNPQTGQPQPYVHLFDNGSYLLNVSVNGIPLTQLSATRLHTSVFLSAGPNAISAANGSLSTDYYVRDGGNGTCTLP